MQSAHTMAPICFRRDDDIIYMWECVCLFHFYSIVFHCAIRCARFHGKEHLQNCSLEIVERKKWQKEKHTKIIQWKLHEKLHNLEGIRNSIFLLDFYHFVSLYIFLFLSIVRLLLLLLFLLFFSFLFISSSCSDRLKLKSHGCAHLQPIFALSFSTIFNCVMCVCYGSCWFHHVCVSVFVYAVYYCPLDSISFNFI